jgi:2-isopropylmalate synthase
MEGHVGVDVRFVALASRALPADRPGRYRPRLRRRVIRVNSQSGKGGIAYLLETEYGVVLPRRLQIDFARHVQERTDTSGSRVTAQQIWALFQDTYLADPKSGTAAEVESFDTSGSEPAVTKLVLIIDGTEHASEHHGIGPVEALTTALARHGMPVDVLSLSQTSVKTRSSSDALTLLGYRNADGARWTAGQDQSVLTATVKAVLNAARRQTRPHTTG